jgi:hypothetical protein
MSRQLTVLLALSFALPRAVYAQYIDPGSSSFLWQLLIAGFAGVAFTLRHYIAAVIRRLRRRKDDTSDEPTDPK